VTPRIKPGIWTSSVVTFRSGLRRSTFGTWPPSGFRGRLPVAGRTHHV